MNISFAELRRTSTPFALAAVAALALSAPSWASVVSETEASGTAGLNDTRLTSQSLDGFFTDQSSNLNIFPNDTNNFSAPIFPSVTVNGRISSTEGVFDPDNEIFIPGTSDIDFFSFNGLSGQKVFFDIDRMSNDDGFDTRLSLFDDTGTLVAAGDDIDELDPGSDGSLDAFIGTYTLPGTGRYYVAVCEFDTAPNALDQPTIVGTGLTRPDGEVYAADSGPGEIDDDNALVTEVTPDDTFQNGDFDAPADYTLHVSRSGAPDPSPVPEPGTMALMGVGLASLVGAKRRRKREGLAAK